MSGLLAACERGVAVAQRMGFAEAEVFALHERSLNVEIEKGTLSAAGFDESVGFGVRIHQEGRVGFAFATEEKRLKDAFEAARKAARLGVALKGFRFPAPAKTPRIAGLFDARIPDLEPATLLSTASDILSGVTDVRSDLLAAGGGVHTSESTTALANSEGVALSHRSTGAHAGVYVVQRRDGVSTGHASRDSTRWDLDHAGLAREAGRLCVDSSNPKPLEKARRMEVVLRPEPSGDLLSTLTYPSLYGKPAHRGESFYSNKEGKQVMDRRVSIMEDSTVPRGLGSGPFDDEGVPSKPRAIVRAGVLKTFLYDHYDAAHYSGTPTGTALRVHPFDGRSFKSPPATSAVQVRLVAPRASTKRLIASIDDGLLVHDMMGVHTANMASGDFSVTSSTLFRIRKGAVEGPVAPVSIAGNLHKALRAGIKLGDDPRPMGGAPAQLLPTTYWGRFAITP